MHIRTRRGWELPESAVTPEGVVINRRGLLAGVLALAGAPAALAEQGVPEPAARNAKYQPGREITAERYATKYNNYYEFSEGKNLWRDAQALKQRPWTIRLEGMVKQPRTIDIDELLKQVQLEERVYRHRCVEAWAMTVPWTGFPMRQLLSIAEPLGSAKYIVFETAQDKVMPGLGSPFYPWPYIDGLTLDEAANELAFISTGLFGKPMPPQNGGPIRMTCPWKYGFKSVKAIVKVTLTDKRPTSFWEAIQPSEYGFWANVNPKVPHPRWSQAQERLLGSDEMVPTQIFNGYGEYVSDLYTDRKNEKLFM
ncbi:MAG: protein-methionine-sulfoxide reductase catalytic subunit MsrP [Acetobacteraceae bacterium]|nr:protein-methionine-sulfoxide reductase catalytic subunit MsrP [Acetobacteraceae bacterium]